MKTLTTILLLAATIAAQQQPPQISEKFARSASKAIMAADNADAYDKESKNRAKDLLEDMELDASSGAEKELTVRAHAFYAMHLANSMLYHSKFDLLVVQNGGHWYDVSEEQRAKIRGELDNDTECARSWKDLLMTRRIAGVPNACPDDVKNPGGKKE